MNFRNTMIIALCLSSGIAGAVGEVEFNGSPLIATPFNIGDNLTGNFQQDGEGLIDYFGPFTTVAGRSYRFVANVTNGSSPGLDLAIGTVNSGDSLVGGAETDANGIGGGGATETRVISPTPGSYYFYIVEATATPNGIQSYSVTTELLPLASVSDWELY